MSQQPSRGVSFWNYGVLLLILLCALVLRTWDLEKGVIWYDERFTLRVLEKPSWTQVADFPETPDTHPPLFHVFYYTTYWTLLREMNFRSLAGLHPDRYSDYERWMVRFPTAVMGVVCVGLLYPWGRRLLLSGPQALLLSFIASFYPVFIYHSQQARMYMLYLALALVQQMVFLGALRRGVWWIAYFVLSTLLLYTHYFAPLLVFSQGVTTLVLSRWGNRAVPRQRFRWWLGAASGAALCFLPWVLWLLRDIRLVTEDYRTPWGRLIYPQILIRQTIIFGEQFPYTWWGWLWAIGFYGALLLGLVRLWSAKRETALLTLGHVLPTILVVFLLGDRHRLWAVKYAIYILPFVLLWVVVGWTAAWEKTRGRLALRTPLAAAFVVWASCALIVNTYVNALPRPDMMR